MTKEQIYWAKIVEASVFSQVVSSLKKTKKTSSALMKTKELKFSFSRCSSCLERTQLSIQSRCASAHQTVPQRHLEAPPCNCSHIWPPRPLHATFFSPFPPPFSSSSLSFHTFFVSSNCKHMYSVSTSCCQADSLRRCCFSPLSSALWHVGRFISALKGVPAKRLDFCWEVFRSERKIWRTYRWMDQISWRCFLCALPLSFSV